MKSTISVLALAGSAFGSIYGAPSSSTPAAPVVPTTSAAWGYETPAESSPADPVDVASSTVAWGGYGGAESSSTPVDPVVPSSSAVWAPSYVSWGPSSSPAAPIISSSSPVWSAPPAVSTTEECDETWPATTSTPVAPVDPVTTKPAWPVSETATFETLTETSWEVTSIEGKGETTIEEVWTTTKQLTQTITVTLPLSASWTTSAIAAESTSAAWSSPEPAWSSPAAPVETSSAAWAAPYPTTSSTPAAPVWGTAAGTGSWAVPSGTSSAWPLQVTANAAVKNGMAGAAVAAAAVFAMF